jgi:3',5'-cyclic AMP phosphodiesterase CpdA
MRLHVLSDLHLEHEPFDVPSVDSDVLVLAGDILGPGRAGIAWAAQPSVAQGRPVLYVPGNHEYYETVYQHEADAMRRAAARSGVQLLERGIAQIGGVRFVGCTLWTDFRLAIRTPDGWQSDAQRGMDAALPRVLDYRPVHWEDADDAAAGPRLLRPADTRALHRQDLDWLRAALSEPFDGPTVVVTHHAPHRGSLAERYTADWVSTAFVNDLPAELLAVPVLWIHGHTHAAFDYRVDRLRGVCNPRGYRMRSGGFEVPAFDAALRIEI